MLLFTEQHTSAAAGKRGIKRYNRRHLSRKLLKGISKKVRRRVLNWDL